MLPAPGARRRGARRGVPRVLRCLRCDGRRASRPAAGQEAEAAATYLLELLAGVERRRSDFERGPVESIVVDGTVVAKVRWRGRAEGQPMTGVMYCCLHGARVISFHAQDLDAAPADGLHAAVRAFETASIGEAAGPAPPPAR